MKNPLSLALWLAIADSIFLPSIESDRGVCNKHGYLGKKIPPKTCQAEPRQNGYF